METFFMIFLYLFLFLLFLITVRNLLISKKSPLNLPPGPWKLPLIGSFHHLLGSLPHHRLRDLSAKYGPLMYIKLGQVPIVIVSSAETAREVMKTHDILFADRPHLVTVRSMTYNYMDIVFSPYGDYWRQLRKICSLELLSQRKVRSFGSLREGEILNHARWIASNCGSKINFSEEVSSISSGIISMAAFGGKTDEQKRFVGLIQEASNLASGFDIAELYPSFELLQVISGMKAKLDRVHQQADMLVEEIIDQHRRKRVRGRSGESRGDEEEDLVDVLLNIQERSSELVLATDTIKAVILDVFGAGTDTSATAADWAMSEMLKNPLIMKQAQDEIRTVFDDKGYVDDSLLDQLQYLKLVINETLRLHPPVPLLVPRECRESCKINGYDIPIKTRVIMNAWALGRDPEMWDDADNFKPERFGDGSRDFKGNCFEYIPFGAGKRICPGMAFGLASVELTLATFLYHFDWSLPDQMKPEKIMMTETFGVNCRRKDNLWIVPVVKRPLPQVGITC